MQFGWRRDDEVVKRVMLELEAAGKDPIFRSAAAHLFSLDDNADIIPWELEERRFGHALDCLDQGQAGTCVGNGTVQAGKDLMLVEAEGKTETDDGQPVDWNANDDFSVEIAYAGSRMMDDNLNNQDGSSGAGAAKFVHDHGYAKRGVYDQYDLSRYSIQLCRQWGARGLPQELVTLANEHPVKEIAQTRTTDDIWTALGFWHMVIICGDISRTMKRQANGFCPQTGNNWPHCQELRGRVTVKGGQRAVIYRNSWGDYLGSDNNKVELASGKVITLPMGCYLSRLEEIASDVRQGDTFALSKGKGWPATRFSWYQ